MTGWLRERWERVTSVVLGGSVDRELDAELEAHLEMAAEEHVRRGMSPQDARRAAATRFGSRLAAREQVHEQRGLPRLESFVADLRYAVRTMRKSPGFTVAAVTMLALGIGVNATVFTAMNAALFKGFPLVAGNDRILYISDRGCCVSYPDFEDWRAQATSFEGMAIVHGVRVTLGDTSGFPERYDATEVSADTFRLAGQRPLLGRDFTPSDEAPGAAPVAILRYGFWERRYAKDPAIVGRTIRINGAPTTVVGVMPQGFSFPQKQDLWVPLVRTPAVQRRDRRETWFAFGRMAEGVTQDGARAEIGAIAGRLAAAYPLTNARVRPEVQTFREFFIGSNATMIHQAMWGAVGFVLLIACANLANLLLARAVGRSREISVRIALGAGRWRLIRQLLVESVLLSCLGGFFGWWVARWGVRLYAMAAAGAGLSDQIVGGWFDDVLDYSLDYRVFAYLVAISVGAGLLFGLAPASRLSKLDVNAALRDGGRTATAGDRGRHLPALLVIGEVALAVVLLAGAGVMIRSFLNVYTADLGIKADNILAALVELPDAEYPGTEEQVSFFDRLTQRLEAVPGVESIALASAPPTWPSFVTRPYELAGAPPVDAQRRPPLWTLTIGPGYFRTLGARMVAGREFDDADGASGVPVVIVNRRFASTQWPGEDPLGKRLRMFNGDTPDAWLTVVGVASDIVQNFRTRQIDPLAYLPHRQRPASQMWVFARTSVPPGGLATAFRREVRTLDSDLPIAQGPGPLDERLAPTYQFRGFIAGLLLMFAAIALLLASLGLYAVIAHAVSRRTQEIGIRMAVGARGRDILSLVFLPGMRALGIGLGIGLAASVAVNRVLQSQLVEVSPSDPVTFVAASVVLILAATLGCLVPARRAIGVDPLVALRNE